MITKVFDVISYLMLKNYKLVCYNKTCHPLCTLGLQTTNHMSITVYPQEWQWCGHVCPGALHKNSQKILCVGLSWNAVRTTNGKTHTQTICRQGTGW